MFTVAGLVCKGKAYGCGSDKYFREAAGAALGIGLGSTGALAASQVTSHAAPRRRSERFTAVSYLWWLFAVVSVAAFVAAMLPGMVSRRQKIFISLAPVVPFLVLLGFAALYEKSVTKWLPVYGAVLLAGALSVVGHWKALRTFMTWRSENPGKPDEEGPGTPSILQLTLTLPVFFSAAILYGR